MCGFSSGRHGLSSAGDLLVSNIFSRTARLIRQG